MGRVGGVLMNIDIPSLLIGKAMGGGGGGKLPDAYQAVEYLQTTNYQGIAIGHSIGDADVTIDVSIDSTSGSETACSGFFDQNSSADAIELFFENTDLKVWNKLNGTGVSTVLVDNVVSGTRYRASFKSNPNLANFHIGFYRLNYFPFKGKIYRAEIEKTDTFHAIFVPCYRKFDNKPGFYDIINMSFFTNIGAGDFTVGPDVN